MSELELYNLHDNSDDSHCRLLETKVESGMVACFRSQALRAEPLVTSCTVSQWKCMLVPA